MLPFHKFAVFGQDCTLCIYSAIFLHLSYLYSIIRAGSLYIPLEPEDLNLGAKSVVNCVEVLIESADRAITIPGNCINN